jgi:hypothetical protein
MSTITGYKRDTLGSYIEKDPEAQLVYSMDWSEWLPSGDQLATATYTISTIAGDTAPLTRVSQGFTGGTISYVELSGGRAREIYTVTAEITTSDGNTDRRAFRVKVINRFL